MFGYVCIEPKHNGDGNFLQYKSSGRQLVLCFTGIRRDQKLEFVWNQLSRFQALSHPVNLQREWQSSSMPNGNQVKGCCAGKGYLIDWFAEAGSSKSRDVPKPKSWIWLHLNFEVFEVWIQLLQLVPFTVKIPAHLSAYSLCPLPNSAAVSCKQ